MSDSSVALTQSLVAMRTAATQQALQTEMVRQQASADQSVVAMLEQGTEQAKASLPSGQGGQVDISA